MKKLHLSLFVVIFALCTPLVQAEEAYDTSTPISPTVKVRAYESLMNGQIVPFSEGSGTLISSDGLILTNAHVVVDEALDEPLGAFSICVSHVPTEKPSCRFTASLLRYDETIDLALLKMNPNVLWGDPIVEFPHLSYDAQPTTNNGEAIKTVGFPFNGAQTIAEVPGEIKGFEKINGFNYLKTDADFFPGNSGGTLLGNGGEFIAVPTYVRSNDPNSGRALDIKEAQQWIDSNEGRQGKNDQPTEQKLIKMWQVCYLFNLDGNIDLESYPQLSMQMPDGWHLDFLNQTEFTSLRKGEFGYFSVLAQPGVFSARFDLNEFETLVDHYFDFDFLDQRKQIKVLGNPGLQFEGEVDEIKMGVIYFPYGHGLVAIVYAMPIEDNQQIQSEIDSFLESLSLNSPVSNENNKASSTLNEPAYPFTLTMPSSWKVLKSTVQGYNLAEIGTESDLFEWGLIDYFPLYQDTIYVNGVNPYTDTLDFGELIFYSDDLVLDGLKGNLSVYQDAGNIPTKKVMAVVKDPEQEFRFMYEGELDAFDEGAQAFDEMLRTFKSKRYDQNPNPEWLDFDLAQQGQYSVPDFGQNSSPFLTDIQGHRYEQSIRHLVDLGVIDGNPDGTFAPDDQVNRAAALKIILQSLRSVQTANQQVAFQLPQEFDAFPDVPSGIWYETYVAEGVDKKIINGYPDGTFKGENPVNLAEALKMIIEAYGLSLISETSDPWYQRYLELALSLNLLPDDLKNPSQLVSRAQLVYMVDQVTRME